MGKKVLLSIEEIRFIWSLGFTSGRVSESVSPKKGYAWEDETPVWNEDIGRVGFANKPLAKRIKSAQQSAQADSLLPRVVEVLDENGNPQKIAVV